MGKGVYRGLKVVSVFLLIMMFVFLLPIKSSNKNSPLFYYSSVYKIKKVRNTDFIGRAFFKQNLCPNVRYSLEFPEKTISGLKLPGYESRIGVWGYSRNQQMHGKIVRALRFQNITSAIEKKYHLPHNLLLAMVMLESGGVELLPNSEDDGGIGLCHMQPKLATMFGLKTLDNCTELRSVKHGKKLRWLIRKHNKEISELVELDDRFHPILNLDCVARMLVYYRYNFLRHSDPWKMAVTAYGGIDKYPVYYNIIDRYRKAVNDKNYLIEVRENFNELNPELTIDGKPASFNEYIKYHWDRNYNLGLREYMEQHEPFH